MLRDLRPPLPEGCISELQLDEWRVGELSAAEQQGVERHLAVCLQCRERAEATKREEARFLERYSFSLGSVPSAPLPVAALPRQRRQPLSRCWLWAPAATVLVAAAGYLIVPLGSTPHSPTGPTGPSAPSIATRTKGAVSVGFVVKRGGEILLGEDAMKVRSGDRLRFFFQLQRTGHVAILSRDARSVVTEYYPGTGQSRAVAAGPRSYLDSSVELDGTLGQERLWALVCQRPFDTAPLLDVLQRGETLEPGPGCILERLDLTKVAP